MKVTTINYHKVFNLGEYQNEKIGVEIEIQEGDDVNKCFQQAREYVEFNHSLNGMTNKISELEYIIENPMEFTGRQVESARKQIEEIRAKIDKGIKLLSPA